MTERIITSTANPLVKDLASLGSHRGRVAAGAFLVEGRREVERAIASAHDVDLAIVGDFAADSVRDVIPGDIDRLVVSEAAFRKISRRQNPDGIAVRMPTPDLALRRSALEHSGLALVAEGIEKPGNIGAMLRTAEALGVDLVILADPVTDVFNPNVIRASQGAVFTMALAVGDAPTVRRELGECAIAIVAGYPTGGIAPWEADLRGSVAIVVGAEATGLGPAWDEPDVTVTIPMAGSSDSLNAATTAALLLYEAVRQRSG